MIGLIEPRRRESYANGWPDACGYRYCHAPGAPPQAHVECLLAEAKLDSNAIATQTCMLKSFLAGQ